MAPPRVETGRGRGRGRGRQRGRGQVPSVEENTVSEIEPQLEGIIEGVEGVVGESAPGTEAGHEPLEASWREQMAEMRTMVNGLIKLIGGRNCPPYRAGVETPVA